MQAVMNFIRGMKSFSVCLQHERRQSCPVNYLEPVINLPSVSRAGSLRLDFRRHNLLAGRFFSSARSCVITALGFELGELTMNVVVV